MVCNNVLEYIGHTPMIRLNRMNDPEAAEVLVKFEGLNVGGSIKTRTAYNMIAQAEKEGKINKDTIIVEPTSGNQGIGLALIGAVKGYKVVILGEPSHPEVIGIAGRCAGFSSLAASSCRLSRTMMQLGETAGKAAAIAFRKHCDFTGIDGTESGLSSIE